MNRSREEMLAEALREIILEAHETIPADGKDAAFHTLGGIARIAVSALQSSGQSVGDRP